MKNEKSLPAAKRGFVRSIILIVGALVALKYFLNFDLVGLLSDGDYRAVWDWLKLNFWDKLIIDIVWTKASLFFKDLLE